MRACLALTLLVGCGPTDAPADSVVADTDDRDVDTGLGDEQDDSEGTGVDEGCGSTSPSASFSLVNAGILDGLGVPGLTLEIDITDDDGDLTQIGFEISWDTEINGVIDASAISTDLTANAGGAEPCSIDQVGVPLTMHIDGDNIDPGTQYDFGLRVTDVAGNVSEQAVVTGWTPNADGSDGGS